MPRPRLVAAQGGQRGLLHGAANTARSNRLGGACVANRELAS